jgi:arylsulfatase A-like enzyme/Flp pilus assembly protein TadD
MKHSAPATVPVSARSRSDDLASFSGGKTDSSPPIRGGHRPFRGCARLRDRRSRACSARHGSTGALAPPSSPLDERRAPLARRAIVGRRWPNSGSWPSAPFLPLCLLALAACGPASEQPADGPVDPEAPLADAGALPSVLLVTLDTLRADVLGCYGRPKSDTPYLDRLASEGVRFSRAYTVTPLTIPAHSSMFTGLLPPRHGVRDNGDMFLDEGATTAAERLQAEGYATMAAVGAEVTSHHWGFAQGFDAFYDDMGEAREEEQNRWRVERRGDEVLADAFGWLEANAASDKPFFGWVHLFDPHSPYAAPEPFAGAHPERPYMAEVAFTDHLVGELVTKLASLGRLDDTWLILTGDHGEGLGSHGEQMHGVLLYDATTRVPMIIRPPGGLEAPIVVDEPVSIVDLLPTVLEIVGAPPAEGIDGMSLLPRIQQEPGAIPADRQVYVESLFAFRHYGWAPQRALVDAEHKLIDSTTPELYARGDRAERKDLAGEQTALVEQMRADVEALAASLEPASATAARVEASPERLAQLEALGYITGVADVEAEPGELLPDPVQRLPMLKEVEQARLQMQSGELEQARATLEGIIGREPGLVDPRVMLVNLLRNMGDKEAALAAAVELDQRQPGSLSKGLVGMITLQLGDPEAAAGILAEALDLDPYLGRCWEPYLHALFLLGDTQRLEPEVARAREHLPELAAAEAMEGVLLVMKGDNEGGETVLRAALERDPNLALANQYLGMSLRFQSRITEAEGFLLEEVRLFDAMAARIHLVEIYADQQRYAEQLEQLQAIVEREPPNFLTHHSLAQALFNLQRYDQAKAAIDTCRELAPEYPACAMLEANVLKKLGDDSGAQAAYQRALDLGEQAKQRNGVVPD